MLLVVGFLSLVALSSASPYAGQYINEFAVEISGGPETAAAVAGDHGFQVVKHISDLGDIFLFRHASLSHSHRSKRSSEDFTLRLRSDPRVSYADQQKILGRYKREIVHDKQLESLVVDDRDKIGPLSHRQREEKIVTVEEMGIDFNDPQFTRMWYLINKGQTNGPIGYDVNVLPVWEKGITGKGVVVCILDDGIDHTHQDLIANYDPDASADLNDNRDMSNDPMPEGNLEENSHGTKCAGEVAAAANNSVCGVGIAYNAKIGGVRMLGDIITDAVEGQALIFQKEYIDIYSASWGPRDDGKTMEGPGPFATKALEEGALTGRDGKGSLYIWATGNGGAQHDDCNCDGYVSSIYSISIGCISDQGKSTYFSEMCPSTHAVIFTGGSHASPLDDDYEDPPIKVVTVDVGGDNDKCTSSFQGTSAAAPLAAGCFALVLEANQNLTWRDVQNIVVETAAVPNDQESGWTVNGGGYHVNRHFGFGSLDCGKMVEAAQNWVTVPEQRTCNVAEDNPHIDIKSGRTIKQYLRSDGCSGDAHIDRLEHVQVHVEIDHSCRGNLSIVLVSPSHTRSQILSNRKKDSSSDGVDWTFMTVHNWGENPSGKWMLEVEDRGENDNHKTGSLLHWSLTFWGIQGSNVNAGIGSSSGANIDSDSSISSSQENRVQQADSVNAHVANHNELEDIMDKEQEESENVDIKQIREWKDDAELYDLFANFLVAKENKQSLEESQYRKNTHREIVEKKRVSLYRKELIEKQNKEMKMLNLIRLLNEILDQSEE